MANLLGVCATLAGPVPPEASGPVPMRPAPKIVCKKLLNAPDGANASWEGLRGKVVVVVFWATWCGPCVASIPAMNKLEAAHDSDPIVFIHITDEEESVVTAFVKKTPIRGWVGIDDERKTFKNYGVKGFPAAVVGRDGTLLGWSHPRLLAHEPGILEDVLAKGSSEGLSSTQGFTPDPLDGVVRDAVTGQGGRNLCDIVIRRSDDSSAHRRGGGGGRGSWSFDSPLLSHLSSYCGVSSARIITTVDLPEDHYDIIALAKGRRGLAMQEAVCRLIGATFGLSLTREKRVMQVYLLKTLPGREPTLTPSWGGVYNDDEMHLTAPSKEILERMKKGENYFFALSPLSWLANKISRTVNKPVVAELGDLPKKADRVYSLCFPYPRGDVEAFRKAFEKNVGLTLVPAQREVEVLVVAQVEEPTSR